MSTNPTEAGKGEHHVYRIIPSGTADGGTLIPNGHYVSLDAVAWYVNKDSGWFNDRIASGALEVRLASGAEKYQAALGTFELKHGARVAPVFDRPVIPDRNYVGGTVGLTASLSAIKKNTAVGAMLKSAASASLGVVAGMVQTASLAGPSKILGAAGEDLIGGVRKVLDETGEKREPLFDFGGLDFTLKPEVVTAPEVYLLLHRGAALDQAQLTIGSQGEMVFPYLAGEMLDDGAWLLLRLRRSIKYSGYRDWSDKARSLRGKIESLVSDVDNDITAKDEALKRLKPSASGDSTIFDEFAQLRGVILADGVLSEKEASATVAQLVAVIAAAKKAIAAHSADDFKVAVLELNTGLRTGARVSGPVAEAFISGVDSFITDRRKLTPRRAIGPKAPKAGARPRWALSDSVFSDLKGMPTSLLKAPRS